jgi:hypothetical protein
LLSVAACEYEIDEHAKQFGSEQDGIVISAEDKPGRHANHFRSEADADRDEAERDDVAPAEGDVAVYDDEDQSCQQREDRVGIVADTNQRAYVENRNEEQCRDHHREQCRCGSRYELIRGGSLSGNLAQLEARIIPYQHADYEWGKGTLSVKARGKWFGRHRTKGRYRRTNPIHPKRRRLDAPRNNHSRPASESVTVSSARGGRGWTPPPLIRRRRGLQQDAPRGKLYVDPARPAWLPQVTLTDLRLGRRRFDIHFGTAGDGFQGTERQTRRGGEPEDHAACGAVR